MKEFTVTLKDGRKATIKGEYEQILKAQHFDADGQEWDGDLIPTVTKSELSLYIGGKLIDHSRNSAYWGLIDINGIKKIHGLKIGFADIDVAAAYEAFIAGLINSGTAVEVKEYNNEKVEAEKVKRIAELEKFIAKYGETKLTKSEAKQARINYNNLYNEGGYGYVPHFASADEIEAAKAELETLRA